MIRSREGWADVNGGRQYHRTTGSGSPVVLLHAGIADSRMWRDQLASLGARHRVIAYDLRGFGQSRMVAGHYSHANDLLGFLDHLNIARVAIIGASMGGKTAIDFALGHPDRISALVVVATAMSGYPFVDADTIAKWEAVDRAMEDRRLEDAAELELAQWVAGPRRKLEQISPAIRELVRDMLLTSYHTPPDLGQEAPMQPPALGRLGELTVPTIVIAGDQDAPDILRIADLLAFGIAGARKVIMPGVAHLPNLEDPTAFNRIVLGFLARI